MRLTPREWAQLAEYAGVVLLVLCGVAVGYLLGTLTIDLLAP